jgi:hypothetical protein
MTAEELSKLFPPGTPVPPILGKLAERSEATAGLLSCDFELTPNGESDSYYWFDGREAAAKQFQIFGFDGMHSLYGYWLYPGRTLADAPIVYLNGEGVENTVLANNLEEFLALLTLGEEAVGLYNGWGESADSCHGIPEFRDWANEEFGIVPPANPKEIVETARRSHPDLDAWINRLIQEVPPQSAELD